MTDLNWLPTFHGFLLVDKPAGITSQDVITRLQHALIKKSGGQLRKRALPSMGHGGTLDPFATGLLVVAVGDGVKLTRYLLGSEKAYEAAVAFGAQTASGDLTNEIIARTEILPRDRSSLEAVAQSFREGPYFQTPPMYSAKKIEGVPLYELARKGLAVDRLAVECRVADLSITEVTPAEAGITSARVQARVTAGTFIRTLAEDLALRAGSLAYLTALRRLGSGVLTLDRAVSLDSLTEDLEATPPWTELSCFIPFHRAIHGILPRMEIDAEVAQRILAGEVRTLKRMVISLPGSVALYCRDRLVAIVRDGDAALGTGRTIERAFPLRFGD